MQSRLQITEIQSKLQINRDAEQTTDNVGTADIVDTVDTADIEDTADIVDTADIEDTADTVEVADMWRLEIQSRLIESQDGSQRSPAT